LQQWYQCPYCGAPVAFGVRLCGNCRTQLNWPAQQRSQPPPPPTPVYQQQQPNYKPHTPPHHQYAISVCVSCQYQNYHEVDSNGEAAVTCRSCSTVYYVRTYEVRAKGGRRDQSSGVKHYRVRVKEPDRDETLFEFDSIHEIEMRAGDWMTGSYSEGKLKYLFNEKIRKYWDVQSGMGGKGCMPVALTLVALVATFIILLVIDILIEL